MAAQFNTLDYANRLESAGVTPAQAEVHAQALAQVLEQCFAKAADTTRLRAELSTRITELEANLTGEIKRVEVTLGAEIREVEVTLRSEIRESENRLRAELKESEMRLNGRVDRLEERMEGGFRHQRWVNGTLITMQLGLYAMIAGLYFR